MSRAQQDQFIDDDEEETCPLCVEEFDLGDKGFRPCPCGYQICQFCYNNVKNNMNGLCPACRRPYNDSDIEWKPVSPEEEAAHKARQAQKQKKTQAALQKEKQKAEADNLSRKHLAGLRVVQKNLVYVTGLSPNFQEDKLLQTLRGEQYFGQYGKIIKIVVSKAKDTAHPQSVGVYVTYERKEDAASCISAVDGSKNGERTLRAQFGTTKYCSAYLRGENCTNRNCMFLHEPGEANESYSRASLSTFNAGQQGPSRGAPPQSQQPVASASQPMARQSSGDRPQSPHVDRPALPSTASWASRPTHSIPSRTESRSTSGTMESPAPTHATPAQSQPERIPIQEQPTSAQEPTTESPVQQAPKQQPRPKREVSPFQTLVKDFNIDDLKFSFSYSGLSQADIDIIEKYPPLFDLNGGARRRQRRLREEEQRRIEQQVQAFQQPPTADQDDHLELRGSLQLGGEPEERQPRSQPQSAIQPPGGDGLLDQRFQFGGVSSPNDRGLTPQQQQQMLRQPMNGLNQGSYLNNLNQASSLQQPNTPLGHQRNASRYSFANDQSASTSVKPVANQKLLNQQNSIMPPAGSNHFGGQHQAHGNQFYTSNVQGPPPGLKATGTPPVSGGMTFGQGHGFATGGLQYGANAGGRNANEEMMRNLLRRDGGPQDQSKREFNSFSNYNPSAGYPAAGSLQTGPPSYASLSSFSGEDSKQRKKKGKKHRHANTSSSSGMGLGDVPSGAPDSSLLQSRFSQGAGGTFGGQATGGLYSVETDFPPLGTPRRQQSVQLDDARRSTPPVPPGFEAQAASESRRSTPTVPPGLARPTAVPDLEGLPSSRPSSRASLKRVTSQITPALPLRPSTPTTAGSSKLQLKNEEAETPTPTPKAATSASKSVFEPKLEKENERLAREKAELKAKAKEADDKERERAVQEKKKKVEEEATKKDITVEPKPSSKASAVKPSLPEATAPEVTKPGELSKPAPKQPEPTKAISADKTEPPNKKEQVPTTPQKPAPSAMQPAAKGKATVQSSDAKAAPSTPSKPEPSKADAQKRKTAPGKLDIAAAVNKKDVESASAATAVESEAHGKNGRTVPQTPSATSKIESPVVPTSAAKPAPKTIRVVSTPKAEIAPAASSATSKEPTPTATKLPSRQPSVASIQLPGTPTSEQVSISDNISMTSTSQSRANSPPPPAGASKSETTPVAKSKTKGQIKKERQERAKMIEADKAKAAEEVPQPVAEEPAQEAIVSRKKKSKKEKEPKESKVKMKAEVPDLVAANETTPTASSPASPQRKPTVDSGSIENSTKEVKPTKPTTPTTANTTRTPPLQSPHEPSPPPTPTLSAAQLIAELKATAPEIQKCIDSLFRTPASNQHKPNQNILPKDLANPATWKQDFKLNLTKNEVDALLKGTVGSVHYGGEDGRVWDRGMITPTGAHLRALTQELEMRFLELEKAIRELPEELRFKPTKPQNEMKFPAVDLENLRRQFENIGGRGVSVMEQMVQDGSTMKKGAFLVDEASKYINEFVMPPATPPPSAGGGNARGQTGAGAQSTTSEPIVPSVDIAERQLNEARRVADERDHALRKQIKKNKKLMGLG